MENLGAMADLRYTGFREITDRDILELHCIMHRLQISCSYLSLKTWVLIGKAISQHF